MEIHIGNIIKEIVKTKNLDIGEFAEKINCSRRNAYKIFDRSSIDSELLIKISKVLGQNLFFSYISDQELIAYKNTKIKAAELMLALKELHSTMIWLDEDRKLKESVKAKRANARK
jgi:predicted transcriptional regulator